MQRHELIVGRAIGPGGGTRLGGTDGAGLSAHVHHHDLVAETVHLGEGVVRERAHVGPQ